MKDYLTVVCEGLLALVLFLIHPGLLVVTGAVAAVAIGGGLLVGSIKLFLVVGEAMGYTHHQAFDAWALTITWVGGTFLVCFFLWVGIDILRMKVHELRYRRDRGLGADL